MLNSIRKFFAPRTLPRLTTRDISVPLGVRPGTAQSVRSLAHGRAVGPTSSYLAAQDARHGAALVKVALSTVDAIERNPKLKNLNWEKVHLTHLVFAKGTGSEVLRQKLPIGLKASQIGAAVGLRSRSGALHVYALMYVA